jgi:hypothetical protein
MRVSIPFIVAGVLSGVAAFGKEPTNLHTQGQQVPTSDLGTQVSEKAALAVAQFQERAGGKLDYSVKSLAMVEEMLAEASTYRLDMSQKDQNALVELLGSYILMVAHKQHGGAFYWNEQREQPILVIGEPKFHVAILAFDKVRGRLGGDKADNIPFFYEGFSERVRVATPGTHATYL